MPSSSNDISASKVVVTTLSGLLQTAGDGVYGVGIIYGVHLVSGYLKITIEHIPWLLRHQEEKPRSIKSSSDAQEDEAATDVEDDGYGELGTKVYVEAKKVIMIGLVIFGGVLLQKAACKLRDGRFQAQIDRFTEDNGLD